VLLERKRSKNSIPLVTVTPTITVNKEGTK